VGGRNQKKKRASQPVPKGGGGRERLRISGLEVGKELSVQSSDLRLENQNTGAERGKKSPFPSKEATHEKNDGSVLSQSLGEKTDRSGERGH